jgi:hypothetical protein
MGVPFRIDTHVHMLIDKTASPSRVQMDMALKYAKRRGLDAVCVMEHLDAPYYPQLVEQLFITNYRRYLAPGVIQTADGLMVFSGAEVSLSSGADVGVHTVPEVLLTLSRTKGFYSLRSLRNELDRRGEDFMIVAHHVLLPGKHSPELIEDARLVDALELPGKDPTNAAAYGRLAATLQLPVVCGSDAHVWIQIGAGSSAITSDELSQCRSRATLFHAISAGDLVSQLDEDAVELVRLAREFRAGSSARQQLTS